MLTSRFSTNRAVREYTESFYLPAAAYQQRSACKARLGRAIAERQSRLRQHWAKLHFGDMEITSNEKFHEFRVQVFLAGLGPDDVQIQLYADPQAEGERASWPMMRGAALSAQEQGDMYSARISSRRPASDYTARIVSADSEAAVPLEISLILWQRQKFQDIIYY